MKRFLKESRRLKTGSVYEKKIKSAVCLACMLTTFGFFGVVPAWAEPTPGEAVMSNVVVRDAAVDGAQVGSLVEGQEVTITDETTGSDGMTWYAITFELDGSERSGWIRSDLVEKTAAAAEDDENADQMDADESAENGTGADAGVSESTETTDGETTDTIDGETAETGALHIVLTDGYVDLADVPEDVAATVSDRFTESSLTILDGSTMSEETVSCYQLATADALVSNDAILTNYYYVYGTNDVGESGWYVFDMSQNSLQKSTLNMEYSLTDTEDAKEEASLELSDSVRMIVAALGLVCVLLLILVIVFSVRYHKLRAMLEPEEHPEEGEKSQTSADQDTKSEVESPKKRESVEEQKEPQAREPLEIMDLDDMDDEDYEAMLGKYLDEYMDAGESSEDNGGSEEAPDDEEDDDLKFL